jgi:hypothetical protein
MQSVLVVMVASANNVTQDFTSMLDTVLLVEKCVSSVNLVTRA